MSEINFLPDTFRKVQRRKQRRPMEFAVIALTAMALLAMWMYSSSPNSTLAARSASIDDNIARIEQQRDEYDRLDQHRVALQRNLMVARETYQPISATHVLARLSSLTPEPVRLIEFELSALRPSPEPRADEPGTTKRVIASSNATNKEKRRDPNVMLLSITGQAPSDEAIVTLIRRLETDPIFTSVALRKSKMSKTKTHYVREFHLDLSIDLDRRFVPASNDGGENDAD